MGGGSVVLIPAGNDLVAIRRRNHIGLIVFRALEFIGAEQPTDIAGLTIQAIDKTENLRVLTFADADINLTVYDHRRRPTRKRW